MTEKYDPQGQYSNLRAHMMETCGSDVNFANSIDVEPAPHLLTDSMEAVMKNAEYQLHELEKERQKAEHQFKSKQELLEAQIAHAKEEFEKTRAATVDLPSSPYNFASSAPPLISTDIISLDALSSVDKLSIRKLQLGPNTLDETFEILNQDGKVILTAKLTFDIPEMILKGLKHSVRLEVFDDQLREVIHFQTGANKRMDVIVCGELFAVVSYKFACFRSYLMFYDNLGRPMLKIKGPRTGQAGTTFNIQTATKVNIGMIDKKPREGLPFGYDGRNHTELQIPLCLDVRCKAAVIAACFLVVHNGCYQMRTEKIAAAKAKALSDYTFRN